MKKKPLLSRLSIVLIAFGLTSTNTFAESKIELIKKRSAEIKEVRALLNDPDQNTRAAAVDVMLKSNDTAMREIAYSVGLNSADDAIRSISLRNKFNELKNITVESQLKDDASEASKKVFNRYLGGGLLSILIVKYDESIGNTTIKTPNYGSSYSGSVSGLNYSFKSRYCTGTFEFNEESIYEGNISCDGVSFPAKIKVI